jgi:hypothetical protein
MNVSGEQGEEKASIDMKPNSFPLKSCCVTPEGNKAELEHHTF